MDFWKNQRVLLTGATGLVGSWLAKELIDRGALVTAFVRDFDPQSEFFRSGYFQRTSIVSGMMEDYSALERAINEYETETVFHLAAQAIVGVAQRSPLQTFETNVRGSYNLLEACRVHRGLVKHIVVASSDKSYGTSAQLPYTEDLPLKGVHPYEVSKSCTDLIAQSYHRSYDLPVTIARCGNIFGGGDLNFSRIIPGTIRSLLEGNAPVLRSDGTFVRDYIYVRDVVNAYMVLAEHTAEEKVKGQAFNFSPEKALTVKEIVDALRKLTGRTDLIPIVQNNAPGEIHSQYLDSSKARQLLSWKPSFNLDEGLMETIEWYRTFLTRNAQIAMPQARLPLTRAR